jgi:hypothetical protein
MAQFKCEICDLGFEQKSKLEQHKKTSHPEKALSAADLQGHLRGINYPATKNDLINHSPVLEDHSLTRLIERLPEQTYRDSAEVSRALGQVISHEDKPSDQPSRKGGKESMKSASASKFASLFSGEEFPKTTDEVKKIVDKKGTKELSQLVESFPKKEFKDMAELEKSFGRASS